MLVAVGKHAQPVYQCVRKRCYFCTDPRAYRPSPLVVNDESVEIVGGQLPVLGERSFAKLGGRVLKGLLGACFSLEHLDCMVERANLLGVGIAFSLRFLESSLHKLVRHLAVVVRGIPKQATLDGVLLDVVSRVLSGGQLLNE